MANESQSVVIGSGIGEFIRAWNWTNLAAEMCQPCQGSSNDRVNLSVWMGLPRYGNVLVFPYIYITVLFIYFSFPRVTSIMDVYIRNKFSIKVSSIRINNP